MSKLETVDIRRIGAEQVADYRAIRLTALQLDPDAFGSTYEVEAARPLTWFEDATRNLAIFGAYADERIVGMIGFGRHTGAKIQHKGFPWGMFVHPSMRRHGAGPPCSAPPSSMPLPWWSRSCCPS
ncbi:GNAT family N-acetyltransferase [Aestuariivirga sp. YIM B02566]|uniref:GNAT family N-acetyltransferase n=1 Tax=Taklimakanibacter albus TaxID=2800327 RepID=A0ACC5RFJ1_9HYPH|nr:GNAT family N-acetyltransferase [Aestuariivirga sp. YIM B02566]MBK1871481.1 GNAT family N-acetyltransferase [Aestuariivirga sp. YIM B02566]